MTVLLDVNVLLALAWPNHVHHKAALVWFDTNHADGWATCAITENGFVRVSSNRRFTPDAKTPGESMRQLERMKKLEGHAFWADDLSLTDSEHVDWFQLQSHSEVTDAYLLALAMSRREQLVTFDRKIQRLVPAAYPGQPLVALRG